MLARFFFLPQCVCDYAVSKRSLIFVPILLQYPGQTRKAIKHRVHMYLCHSTSSCCFSCFFVADFVCKNANVFCSCQIKNKHPCIWIDMRKTTGVWLLSEGSGNVCVCVCVCALVQTQAWNVARNEWKELMKLQKLHGDFAIWILSAVAAEEVEQKPWHLSFILWVCCYTVITFVAHHLLQDHTWGSLSLAMLHSMLWAYVCVCAPTWGFLNFAHFFLLDCVCELGLTDRGTEVWVNDIFQLWK